jgi:hypothetical protein
LGTGSTFMLRLFLPELQRSTASRTELAYAGQARPERVLHAEPAATPPLAYLLAIREHARIGYVKGIGEELERIQALDPIYDEYIARVRELAKTFRTADILTLIEEAIGRERSNA